MNTPTLLRALLPTAAAALGSTALAQGFVTLPTGSFAASAGGGLSSNGRYATGSDSGGAFLWDATNPGVVVSLGQIQGIAVSDDGTRVLGRMDDPLTGNNGPGIWVQGTGWVWCDPFAVSNTCSPNNIGSGYDMSNDGMVVTGLGWEGCKARAIDYDANLTQPFAFHTQQTTNSARGNCVSGDGQWFGGWERVGGSQDVACIWMPDGSQIFPVLGSAAYPDGLGGTWGFSTDGVWACGEGGYNGDEPWRYNTTTSQLDFLGSMPSMGLDDKAVAKAISDDGRTIVGIYGGNGFFGSPQRAFIWREGTGMEDLGQLLLSMGLAVPGPLQNAIDISADGRAIYGGLVPSGIGFVGDAYLATFADPVMDLGGSSAGTGGLHPVLTASGTFNPGTAFTLDLDDAAGSAISILLVSVTNTPVPLFGGTLHPFPLNFTQALLTSVTGDWQINSTWPPNVSSGIFLVFQTAVFDPAAVGQFALSNGLKTTTP